MTEKAKRDAIFILWLAADQTVLVDFFDRIPISFSTHSTHICSCVTVHTIVHSLLVGPSKSKYLLSMVDAAKRD